MTKPDAILTLCKEWQMQPTRRSWLAVTKAYIALDLTDAEIFEAEKRMGFRDNAGEFYPEILPKPRKPKLKKFDWSNVR